MVKPTPPVSTWGKKWHLSLTHNDPRVSFIFLNSTGLGGVTKKFQECYSSARFLSFWNTWYRITLWITAFCCFLRKCCKTHCGILGRKAQLVAPGGNPEAILPSCGKIRVCKWCSHFKTWSILKCEAFPLSTPFFKQNLFLLTLSPSPVSSPGLHSPLGLFKAWQTPWNTFMARGHVYPSVFPESLLLP